ncbi:M15 family metallopeptidase [Propionicimonas sp.]|uniref:M15 family metallopeptidase n=1 Tax=Propionicimonas sp. TaxID=1955623 RepID=UPI0017A1AC58|nr:M15 family metallopeptidase [Propionicimonas sp.]MBU3977118.1 M15 family metallopeptidase [Actinomycetota bacterium]MBA3020687.1 M15 family metallopeptidase [Propionicimonas sp.]MBU3985058.1 M15 family metallopeptidase [Actinomycetota bacterium]MBU4006985.1 M15 family metallopeptidase [Actinomycetota bacterium]MBU4064738.1 M15 family metallopeptidase [Actinomycetota bacterium]
MTRPRAASVLTAALVLGLLSWSVPLAWGEDSASPSPTPSTTSTASPSPSPTPTLTPVPTPTPTPECRGVADTRGKAQRKSPFVVCGVVVISKTHRVNSKYHPKVVKVKIAKHGIGTVRLNGTAASALKKLFASAKKAGHRLVVRSAYRPYSTQQRIYRPGMTLTAPPGASEHQSGLAADLALRKSGRVIRGYAFGRSKAGKWVAKHAAEFGFVIRYPKGKQAITKIPYEPWHLRYVGVKAAVGVAKTTTKTLERYLLIG